MIISNLIIPNTKKRMFAVIRTSEFNFNNETKIDLCTSLKDLYHFGFDTNEVNYDINNLKVNDIYVSKYYGKCVIVIRTE